MKTDVVNKPTNNKNKQKKCAQYNELKRLKPSNTSCFIIRKGQNPDKG